MIDRRSFLSSVGGAAVLLAARPSHLLKPRRLKRVGLQLYTVRDEMKRDLPGALARVARTGYKEVEFAGYFDRPPTEIRDLLAKNKLTSPSAHVAWPDASEGWQRVLADAKTVGHDYVTVPWVPEEQRKTLDDWKRIADLFNRAAQQAKDAGLRFAYHNHNFEFIQTEGAVPYDTLLASTDPALVHYEMDLYWMVKAGQDPIAYFDQHPGRFTLVHVKDATAAPDRKMADVGHGTIDFAKIFAHDAANGAHIEHYFVERDDAKDEFQSIKNSYAYLSKLSY